jgi:hypothetical protein
MAACSSGLISRSGIGIFQGVKASGDTSWPAWALAKAANPRLSTVTSFSIGAGSIWR